MQGNTSTARDVELFLPVPNTNEISNDVPRVLPLQKLTSAKKSRRGKKGDSEYTVVLFPFSLIISFEDET